MRQKFMRRLATGVAITALAATSLFSAPLVSGKAMAAAENSAEFEIRSFAAAFLAARSADNGFDTKAAIRFYKKALEFDPDNVLVRERLMIDLFLDGQFGEGVKIVQSLEKDEAIDQIRDMALAIDAIKRGNFDDAVGMLDTATTNPIDRLLNSLLTAWADVGAGNGAKALADLEALDGPPWYPIFKQFHSGAIAEVMGDYTRAREIYSSTITDKTAGGAAPDTFIRAVMALAALEARSGNTRVALDTLAVGEDFTPGFAPLSAMRQTIENGEKPEAEIGNAVQGAAAVMFSLGSAISRQGAEETVTLYLQFARALDPDNARTLVTLGSMKEALGKPEEAIEIYKMVPEQSPMRRVSELQLGLALANLDKKDEAKKHLKELIDADPSDIRSYLAYGSVLSSDKDYDEMAANYQRAVDVVGPGPTRSDWNLFFQLGIAYERLKKWPQAEAALKRALQLYPEQPQVMNYLGYTWIDMNRNLEEGMEMIRAAVDLRPNDGYIVDSLGWAYYRLGDYENAVRELERAVELMPADPTINDHLGDAYWRVGRKVEAGFQWNRALANDPEADLKSKVEAKLENGLAAVDANSPAAVNEAPISDETSEQPDDRT